MLLKLILVLVVLPVWGTQYSVMIDAGSTGSRVYVYEFDREHVKLVNKLKIMPGLSSFEKNLPGIKPYIDQLVTFAKEQISDNTPIDQVSIKLQATGGVRALPKLSQKRVILETQKALELSGFKNPRAEVISGINEGIYAWVAVNYLLGSLQDLEKPTANLIEMGGASLQVTTLRNHKLKPGKIDSQISSRTYNTLGEATAWHAFAPKACQKIPLKYADCRRSLMRNIKPVPRPKLEGQFYLVDEFKELTALMNTPKISLDILDQQGEQICQKNLETLKQELPQYAGPGTYLPRLCFQTAYMSVVLEKIGFKRSRELISTKEINDTALSWTLGSLVLNK